MKKERFALPLATLAALVMLTAGCGQKTEETTTHATDSTVSVTPEATAPDTGAAPSPEASNTMPVVPTTPPDHIEVQHVLIGFQGSVPGKTVTRTKAEAEQLAQEVLAKARKGENMDALVQQYTDDQFPGVYDLSNTGITPDKSKGEYARGEFVKGFSDVAFGLSVGNVGIANYDPQTSGFGWHIIKRLR